MKTLRVSILVLIVYFLEKGLLYFDQNSNFFANYAHDTLLSLIVVGAIFLFIIIFFGIRKNGGLGFRADDELTTVRKWKVGYLAYRLNLILWLFLFSDRMKFTDISNLIGGGIILSLFVGVLSLLYFRFYPSEK